MIGRGLLAIAFLVPLFGGCIDLGGALSAPSPIWESGYTFGYVDSAVYDVKVSAEGENEKESGKEGPIHYTAEVLNTTLGGVDPVYIVAYDGSPISTGFADSVADVNDVWLLAKRQSDLAPVGAYVTGCDKDADCESAGLQTFGLPEDYTYLDFPLTSGKTWGGMIGGGSANGQEFVDEGMGLRYQARVQGTETVKTPLGDLRTVQVDFKYDLVGVEEMRKEMERAMRESGGSVKRFNIDYDVREHVYYSPEYQTVAKSVVDMHILVDMAFQPQGSQMIEVKVDVDVDVDSLLEGAQLIPKPERDAKDMAAIARGALPLGSAKGSPIRSAGYGLSLSASNVEVNAAEPESVAFTGSMLKTSALPDGHVASWTIQDFEENVIASGKGLSFDHTFDEPGQYRAILESRDENGTLTAVAAAFVFAEYHAKATATCPTISLEPFFPACDGVPVPVRPGIRSLTVAALTSGPAANPVSPEMRVRDASGNEETNSGNYVVIEDFVGFDVDERDWTAEYYHAGVSMTDVEYRIDLEYAPEAAAATSSGASMGGVVGGLASAEWLVDLLDATSAAQMVTTVEARLFA